MPWCPANMVMIGCRNRNTTTRSSRSPGRARTRSPLPCRPRRRRAPRRRGSVIDVGGDDGPPRPHPGPGDRAARTSALAYLVLEPFEVDDERVRRHTQGDDETGDSGQREREADRPAEQDERAVRQQAGQHQAARRSPCRAAGSRRTRTRRPAARRCPGEQAGPQLVRAERGRDRLAPPAAERQRQRAELELVGQQLRASSSVNCR